MMLFRKERIMHEDDKRLPPRKSLFDISIQLILHWSF